MTGPDGFAPVVYDFARDSQGRVLATGRFQYAGARRVDPLVRLQGDEWRSATQWWRERPPEIGFSAMAVHDDGYMALSRNSGPFGRVPSEIWLVNAGEIRVIGHLRGSVRSMVWFQERLWVAGAFTMEENGVSHLAVWDGASWSAPPGGAADAPVYRLARSGNAMLAAGDFTTIGGRAARSVAEWNGTSWRAYDLGPDIQAVHVYAVTRGDNGDLFVGGAITGGILRWNGDAWEQLNGGVFVREGYGAVSDIAMHGGALYVTGCFSHLNAPPSEPGAVRAESVARWRSGRWESLDDGAEATGSSWFEYQVCGGEPNPFTPWDMRYQRLFSDGERLFLGGMMPGVDGVPSQSIAIYDGRKWIAAGENGEGLSGGSQVVAAGGPQNAAYVFGGITHAGDTHGTSGVFRYDNGWHAVGGPLPRDLVCNNLAVDRAGLAFLGCSTRPTGTEQGRPVVLRQEGDNWTPLESGSLAGIIQDMRFDSAGVLWIAGGVRLGPAEGSGFLARAEGNGLTIVEDGFNSMVFRIAFSPRPGVGSPELLVGGAFTQIDGAEFRRIARWTNGKWEALGTGFDSGVLALAWGENAVFASTEEPNEPGLKQFLIGRWDGAQWVEIATPENGLPAPREETVHTVRDLLAQGRYLVAVGSVWPETGGRNAFVYDGTRFEALGGGLNAISIDSVALAADGLWCAGHIAEAGTGQDRIPTVGVARFALPGAIPNQ